MFLVVKPEEIINQQLDLDCVERKRGEAGHWESLNSQDGAWTGQTEGKMDASELAPGDKAVAVIRAEGVHGT